MSGAASKVMIVTGTSKGIGRHLIEYYLAQGYRVAGCSRSDIDGAPSGYLHYRLDVADEEAVTQMVWDVHKHFGRLDVLINNAGIASMNHSLLTPLKTVTDVFATNVFGSFLFAREAAKVMMKRKFGRIVNFATVATPLRLEGEAAYAASKAAIVSYTQIMARELGAFNITVNALGPTPVQTDLIRSVPRDKIQALIDAQAIKRMGEFRDIENVIDFFISPGSDFVTAQTVYLGGVS